MENKLISRVLFGMSILIFVITFYFVYGMITNGTPQKYDPAQLGIELINSGEATNANYIEKGQALYERKIGDLEGNISAGIGFAQFVLYLGVGLMLIFLIYGLYVTATSDIKKAIPSFIFVGLTIIAFIWAAISAGGSTEGLESAVADRSAEDASSILSMTNFWVGGVMILFVFGSIILVVDLIKGIVRSASN
jgi:hypothetical protein